MELRVVAVPTSRGLEDVVLRLLAGAKPLPLDAIGLTPANLKAMRDMVRKPYGLVLVVGPTGCGKTTTLHSVISDINTAGRKIWTAEDPIEITQSGLRQVQVNPRIGWTFAAAMRTFLRADPDVIMIGEMRDEETSRIAIEASLTGIWCSPPCTPIRPPEHCAAAGDRPGPVQLLGFAASPSLRNAWCDACARLAANPWWQTTKRCWTWHRSTCPAARADSPEGRAALVQRWRKNYGAGSGEWQLWRRGGLCQECEGHGYRGRAWVSMNKLMLSDEAIRQHIRRRASAEKFARPPSAAGMLTLRQDDIEKVLHGLTYMSEVLAASNL